MPGDPSVVAAGAVGGLLGRGFDYPAGLTVGYAPNT